MNRQQSRLRTSAVAGFTTVAVVSLASCSTPTERIASTEVAHMFSDIFFDYDVVETGQELAEIASLVVEADLVSISSGPALPDVEGNPVDNSFLIFAFGAIDVLSGDLPSRSAESLKVIFSGTSSSAELLGGQSAAPAEGRFVLYLEPFVEDPAVPLIGDVPEELFMPVGPQGVYLEGPTGDLHMLLEQGTVVEGDLADVHPGDAALPVIGHDDH